MRGIVVLILLIASIMTLGCKTAHPIDSELRDLPSYESIASIYNQRIDALPSVWARGVVSIEFTNQKGKRQTEQGNCYLHMVRPSNISFIINKLEQQYLRLGCNERVYWAMDMQEKTARTGDHTEGEAVIDRFGLPITPNELLTVFALACLPEPDGSQLVTRDHDGRLVVTYPSAVGRTVYTLEPVTFLPRDTELIDSQTGDTVVRASFSKPGRAPVPGQGAYSRQVPGQIDIHDLVNDSRIKITLGTISATREIDPDNFDLDHLLDVLGPFTIVEP